MRGHPAGLGAVVLGLLTATLAPTNTTSAAAPAGPGPDPQRIDVVSDARGDTVRARALPRGPRPYRRLADVTEVRYKTPSRTSGALRITSTWNDLRDGSRPGVRRQVLVTYVFGDVTREVLAVRVTNASDRVKIVYPGDPSGLYVTPEEVAVDRTFGPGGRTDVDLSTEWLDGRDRVRFDSTAFSGDVKDPLDFSRVLDAGPAR